ncbi:MAG: hypothetical protein JEZ14_26330 [Marinilabiliaceae bacterium]|nr:hypothetical protein [Marinilabiliaceae bacterium]
MKSNNLVPKLLLSLLWLLTWPALPHAQAIVATLEKSFSGINSIQIEGDYCAVEVSGTTTSDVQFKGEIRSSDHYYLNIHQSVNGGVLKIWVDHPKTNPGNTKGQLTFMVPARTTVTVKNANGHVLLENLSGSQYTLTTTLGKITTRKLSAKLVAHSTSGSVNVLGLKGDLESTTRMGAQQLKDITGQVTATAETGTITASGINGNITLHTTRGNQSLNNISGHVTTEAKEGKLIMTGIKGNIKASTERGAMELNQVTGALQLSTISGSQRGTGVRLTDDSSFQSTSGTINMQLTNGKQELSFYLTATSGHLKAKGTIGRRNLVIDQGGIKVTGKTASGSQTYF